jgi:hypothetical protein
MPMPTVQHTSPSLVGLTPEVFTVSALLSMPAVWTAVVQRELPVGVLMERFLIVLLTCALLAELVRRLGEGGALHPSLVDAPPAPAPVKTTASQMLFDDSDLGFSSFDDYGTTTAPLDAPLALDPAIDVDAVDVTADGALDAGLAGFGSMDDLGDLAPLDLNADPFSDPV